ncbi:signal peptidase I [Vagococcus coleopterorum]|uniref:Signal peptidase I n=1 Tax=Vagococcus coleopterorum TaxID=2714946 RepID=A0A6G8ANT7_9ENTE|nr:signal peptidase I [Vagococcus coleopterorum]QIL46657.1 signal peptidase I [Vagococcus coleopterorum]
MSKISKSVWLSNIIWFVGLVAVMLLVRHYVFTPVVVSGKSMDPTMQDGERVFALRFGDIDRQDVVTFPAPDEQKKSYIKRVIGLPGERVRFEKGQLFVNDKLVKEPYLDKYQSKLPDGEYLTTIMNRQGEIITDFDLQALPGNYVTIPEGKLFVMGDNRQNSKDSRIFGLIDEETISGNVKFVFWPPSKFGTMK